MAAFALPIIGGIGSLFSGLFGSSSAKKASQQVVAGDTNAENRITGAETQALGNLNPYLNAGSQATGNLSQLLGTPGQGLLTPWTQQFMAPTAAQVEQTPGYQFQLQQGTNALQNSAAARGGLLSGRTLADLNAYGQGLASTNYQNAFNNALTQYGTAYGTFENNQANAYSRLMGQEGMGLNAVGGANQVIGSAGNDLASLDVAIGKAKAGGTLGSSNAWSGAISGIGGAAASLPWGNLFQMNPNVGTGMSA